MPEDVTSLDDVVQEIIKHLHQAGQACKNHVLPGSRPKVMLPLQRANTLLKAVAEVLERSEMGKKLGFVKTKDGIQPVETSPVKDEA